MTATAPFLRRKTGADEPVRAGGAAVRARRVPMGHGRPAAEQEPDRRVQAAARDRDDQGTTSF